MFFIYTKHAEENIAERHLVKKIVEDAIISPDSLMVSRGERKVAHKEISGKLLRVIYEESEGNYIIITAYYTNRDRYR